VRAIFGVLGLLVALGIVGWLAKTQLASTRQSVPPFAVPGVEAASAPAATVRDQSQKIQQQIKQSVEAAMQQPRPMPDDR
jgi:hypothetical protein